MASRSSKYTTTTVVIIHTVTIVDIMRIASIDMDIGFIVNQLYLEGALADPKRSSAERRALIASSDGCSV